MALGLLKKALGLLKKTYLGVQKNNIFSS